MSREFGIYPNDLPTPPTMWWGARALIEHTKNGPQLTLLWDRQSSEFLDDSQKYGFIDWINDYVIPFLDKKVKEHDTKFVQCHNKEGTYCCVAEDRGSGGYLYIGAWSTF